ncbi:MAG: hypothetical protein ABIY52_12495 [Gemmatimonadaceae bacterium]
MITIRVDTDQLTRDLRDTQTRQVPFALVKALNALASEDVQPAERRRLREVFTLRREAWADRSIKITHFAKKAEPFVTIAIKPPGTQDRSDILGKFEDQTEKRAIGGHGVAVPMDVKRTKGGMISKGKRPGALHLHREGGRVVGDNGTYIVRLADGRELLLQRGSKKGKQLAAALGINQAIGGQYQRGRNAAGQFTGYQHARTTQHDSTLLYLFRPEVKIRPDLHFVPTATQMVTRMWPSRFADALTLALSTAR